MNDAYIFCLHNFFAETHAFYNHFNKARSPKP
jgi:hypothetical protein